MQWEKEQGFKVGLNYAKKEKGGIEGGFEREIFYHNPDFLP